MPPLRPRTDPCAGDAIARQLGACKVPVLCELSKVQEDDTECDDVTIAELLGRCKRHSSGLHPRADPPRGRRKAARPRKTATSRCKIMPAMGRGGICYDDLSPSQRGKRMRTWRAGVLAGQMEAKAARGCSAGDRDSGSQAHEFPEAITKGRTQSAATGHEEAQATARGQEAQLERLRWTALSTRASA